MSEYIDWQPDDSPDEGSGTPPRTGGYRAGRRGRVPRRSARIRFAGQREVLVEDFARLDSGPDFRPIEEWFAGWNRHSLPAVGYFRRGRGTRRRLPKTIGNFSRSTFRIS